MASSTDWIRIRFASRLAALQVANEILQYVYTLEDPEDTNGPHRLVMWSTVALTPEPILFLNRSAIEVADRLRLMLPARETVSSAQLPSARTLLFGLPGIDLLH